MRRILIDTNIYVAFKRDDPEVVEVFRNTDLIGIDVSALAELYSGFQLGNRMKQNVHDFQTFLNRPRVQIYSHDIETSQVYAHIFKSLRLKGKPIPANDIWIASVAMQHGLALYSRDRHFNNIDGLMRYNI